MGQEIFFCHTGQGENEARQNHAWRGHKPPSFGLVHPIAIPTYMIT